MRKGTWLIILVLGIGSIIEVGPILYMASVSLMNQAEITAFPLPLIPSWPQVINYPNAWTRIRFPILLWNTAYITIVTVGVGTLLQILAAYAFGRLQFWGRDIMFIGILGTMMIPRQVIMIPVYILLARWPLSGDNDLFGVGGHGLLNSATAVILPTLVAQSGFSIFLLRQSIKTMPQELEDAARIDGAGTLRIIFQIFTPLMAPVIATLTVLHFMGAWNDFLWPLIVLNDSDKLTLTVGINLLQGQFGITDWHTLMAAVTLATFPILLLYIFAQRYFVRGIAITGMKG